MGHNISAIAAVKKKQASKVLILRNKLLGQTNCYASDLTPEKFDLLASVKVREFHLHMTEVTSLDLFKCKQTFFEQGDKNCRFLAMLSQHDAPITIIPEM